VDGGIATSEGAARWKGRKVGNSGEEMRVRPRRIQEILGVRRRGK
jgi:hypothetical protein